jgi:four helix bundle protein
LEGGRWRVKGENVVRDKSFAFAVRVVRASQHLAGEKKEFVLSKQLLRSGTSVGANVEEALGGQSDADFVSKLSIAYKESRETCYWLRLLHATGYLTESQSQSLLADADELCRLLARILLTMKQRRPNV